MFVALMIAIIFILMIYYGIKTVEKNFSACSVKRVQEIIASQSDEKPELIKNSDIEKLPVVVQKWLQSSKVIGKERIKTCRSRQKILLRLKQNAKWMPATAVQYITTEKPGFIWTVKVRLMPLLFMVGRDQYFAGKGSMLIKLLALFKAAEGSGEKVDQGALLRFLGECIWYPTAALESYISWEEVDNNSAKATMSYGSVTASGIFSFNEEGAVKSFSACRYMDNNGEYTLEEWMITVKEYGEFSGIRIPVKCDAAWKLASGEFHWYQVEIEDTEYNVNL